MPRQLEITIPLDQWHMAMLNPELWVESIEAVRRISGQAVYDTRVVEKIKSNFPLGGAGGDVISLTE